MAFGIEKYKDMEIPIPNDEEVLLVPRAHVSRAQKDAILVFTNKGIHFRVRKDKVGIVNYFWGDRQHNLIDNTFLAYDRIHSITRGKALWKHIFNIEMVDGCKIELWFVKDNERVNELLEEVMCGIVPNTAYYDYNDHHPERVPHRKIPVANK